MLGFALLLLALMPDSLWAQQAASGRASVRVGTVSQLDVDPVDGWPAQSVSTSDLRTGTVRVRVRANHRWQLVLASGFDATASVTVRAIGPDGASTLELVPGGQAAVTSGEQGEEILELELSWDGSVYPELSAVPVTYTLASVDG